jgi:hypothetical protein
MKYLFDEFDTLLATADRPLEDAARQEGLRVWYVVETSEPVLTASTPLLSDLIVLFAVETDRCRS